MVLCSYFGLANASLGGERWMLCLLCSLSFCVCVLATLPLGGKGWSVVAALCGSHSLVRRCQFLF